MKKQKDFVDKVYLVESIVNSASLVSVEDMRGPARLPEFVDARMAVWFVLNKHIGMPYTMIARLYNRDHTSIMHGVSKVDRQPTNLQEWVKEGIEKEWKMWGFLK
ncbi:TPA: hypothetical protein DEB29_03575 [Candidatus Wolfebacteria bacterium]|nr:hypothetical protein [Candidatus Wolfebacteria bacterium]